MRKIKTEHKVFFKRKNIKIFIFICSDNLYSDFEIVIPYSYERTDSCVNKICNN